MKKLYFTILIAQLAFTSNTFGQNIAINELGNLPDTSAMLDISSVTKRFLAPRMTTTQQNNIPLPATGLLIYNTSEGSFRVNKGTPAAPNWVSLAAGGPTTNTASMSANTLTTTVNGVAATAPIISTNVLTLTGTKLTSTINGVSSSPTELASLQNLSSSQNIEWNTSALSYNQSFVGTFETAVAGEAVVFGDLLYFDFGTKKWKKANANDFATTPVQRMALESIAANASGKMLIEGFIRNDAWSFTAAVVYLSSSTSGAVTNTPPSTSNDQVQRIGIALSNNKLQFRPSLDIIKKN